MTEANNNPSESIRLSLFEWCITLLLVGLTLAAIPLVWKSAEKIDAEAFKRVSFPLHHDYWLFNRYAKELCQKDEIPILGGSVIWGHFVRSGETLSAHLNQIDTKNRFVNLGLNGAHPAALAGLIEHFAKPINNQKVMIHFNMLWMASKRQDLSWKKSLNFSHPELVPQFLPNIQCYRNDTNKKLGILVKREIPFLMWKDHLIQNYFGDYSLLQWILKNPHSNPLKSVNFSLLGPDIRTEKVDTRSWHEKNIFFTPKWISLEKSFQWDSFKRCLDTLQSRNNEVFVLVGPLNIHAMKEDRREKFM